MSDNKLIKIGLVIMSFVCLGLCIGGLFLPLFEYGGNPCYNIIEIVDWIITDFKSIGSSGGGSISSSIGIMFNSMLVSFSGIVLLMATIYLLIAIITNLTKGIKFINGEDEFDPNPTLLSCGLILGFTIIMKEFYFGGDIINYSTGAILIIVGLSITYLIKLGYEVLYNDHSGGIMSYAGTGIRFVISVGLLIVGLTCLSHQYVHVEHGFTTTNNQFLMSKYLAQRAASTGEEILAYLQLFGFILLLIVVNICSSSYYTNLNALRFKKFRANGTYINPNHSMLTSIIASLITLIVAFLLTTLLKPASFSGTIEMGAGMTVMLIAFGIATIGIIAAFIIDKKQHQ